MTSSKDEGKSDTVWDGYADYRTVSRRMAMSIEDAVDSYAALKALHREGARIKPTRAASARRDLQAAALRLRVEMEPDEDDVEGYEKMLARWKGEDGYLDKLDDIRLQNQCPDWLDDFAEDIRRAGWELGYLQAGRSIKAQEEDPAEREANSLLRD